jgi:hypothetical protein
VVVVVVVVVLVERLEAGEGEVETAEEEEEEEEGGENNNSPSAPAPFGTCLAQISRGQNSRPSRESSVKSLMILTFWRKRPMRLARYVADKVVNDSN